MSRFDWILVVVIASIIGVLGAFCITEPVRADAPPPSSAQQRPDIFPCDGCFIPDHDGDGDGDLQDLNPITRKVKQTRAVTYRVRLISGCNYGNYDSILATMERENRDKVGINITRNDVSYDFTVYISCGLMQINKCGSVNVFCLPDGFPSNGDVYMSDVLSGWDAGSQKGIALHEISPGHAVGTWNEQYATCGASCGFQPTPNMPTFMNTGAQSRIGIEANDCARFMRTMWEDVPCAALYGFAPAPPVTYPVYDAARGCMDFGYWCYRYADGLWIDPNNVSEWGPQEWTGDGGFYQFNRRLEQWFRGGQNWESHQGGLNWRCEQTCWP